MRFFIQNVFVFFVLFVFLSCDAKKAEYPARDITNVVIFAAGGGTDTCNRMVSAEMAEILGVNINVVNKTGGVCGSVGLNDVYNRPPNGYTLCGLSESCLAAGGQGGFNKRMNVWDFYLVGGSPDVLSITPDLPYKTLKELIEVAKQEPKSIRAAASNAGSVHHLNLLALEKGSGANFNYIPYPGSGPSHNAAMTGEITVVITSIAEQAQLIRSGKLKPLATLIPEPFTLGEITIPSAFDAYPELADYLPIPQSIGFAVHGETPDAIKLKLADAFKQALQTQRMKVWAEKNYYVLSGKTGEEAQQVYNYLESLFSWTLWKLGGATVDPASLGIPKPETFENH